MRKSRDQHLYDELYRILSEDLELDVYTTMPPEGAALPFVKIGETMVIPEPFKRSQLGRIIATIEVWSHGANRIDCSTITANIEEQCNRIAEFDGALYSYEPDASNKRILPDNSTTQKLWHGILTAEFLILK